MSPAAIRSSVVASARSGAVRLPATTNAIPTPSSAAMTNAASRIRKMLPSGSARPESVSSTPNAASGTSAAMSSAVVIRTRNGITSALPPGGSRCRGP